MNLKKENLLNLKDAELRGNDDKDSDQHVFLQLKSGRQRLEPI